MSEQKRKPVPESDPKKKKQSDMPAAGRHATPALTDYDKTPGTGILPKSDEENVQPTG